MYNFDKLIERRGTGSIKWELIKASGKHEDTIPLWVADMDFETMPEITAALIERAKHPIYGYTMIMDDYLEAFIGWMKRRFDFNVEKEWVTTTPGVVTALGLAIQAYTKPGDKIIINKPIYYPFDIGIAVNERIVVENPMIYKDNKYYVDFEDFERKIIENDVKLFILCNPHNPIGKVWTQEELQTIGNICKKHGVIVVSDEIHQDFVYQGHTHIPFYKVDESFKEFSIICTAPSKTFNLAGLQTSNIVIANKDLRDKFETTKTKVGLMHVNIFGIEACKTAYQKGDQWVDELVEYLQGNIDYLTKFFEEKLPQCPVIKSEGLYLVWVDFSKFGMGHLELEEFMLNKAKLWLDEGYIFGTGGELFERFNVACPRAILVKALDQLEEALNTLK